MYNITRDATCINVRRIVRLAHLTPLDVQTRTIIESELMINFACK